MSISKKAKNCSKKFFRSGGKYRSKYRRKRRSSSSSSEADAGNGNSAATEAPPPPPVKRYYGRKRTETDEEKLTEDEDGPASEYVNYYSDWAQLLRGVPFISKRCATSTEKGLLYRSL